jgi:hypothetical protein
MGYGKTEPATLQVIQNVYTNVPAGTGTKANKQYLDPQPPDDKKPFYYTDAQLPKITSKSGYDLLFLDDPKRSLLKGDGTS